VYLCCGATDMRKRINGLVILVQKYHELELATMNENWEPTIQGEKCVIYYEYGEELGTY